MCVESGARLFACACEESLIVGTVRLAYGYTYVPHKLVIKKQENCIIVDKAPHGIMLRWEDIMNCGFPLSGWRDMEFLFLP
jgi:hypothetical protein